MVDSATLVRVSETWANTMQTSRGNDGMRANRNRATLFLSPLTLLALILLPEPVQAAEAPTSSGPIVEVVITGSLIKRQIDRETAVPITTIGADALLKANATTPQAVVGLITQNQYSAISNTSVLSGTGFATYANLRALGSPRTLVLFDGQRVVNQPYQGLGVDLNTIPLALLDRVEVLTDGASSIYGSDAIAGVVNFIPKAEYAGASITVSGTEPQLSGGGASRNASAAVGFGSLKDDRWNAYVASTWHRTTALSLAERRFTNTNYIPSRGWNRLNVTTFPANYSQAATRISSVNPTFPACNPPSSVPNAAFGAAACGFDSATLPSLAPQAIPDQEQYSFFARARFRVGEEVATVQYFRGYDDVTSTIAPVSLANLTMTPNNPYYPGKGITPGTAGLNPALPITLNWRVTAAGASVVRPLTIADRLDANLLGQAAGWDYKLWALQSTSSLNLRFLGGYVDVPNIRNGLIGAAGAPFLNPFGAQSATGAQFIQANVLTGIMQHAESKLMMFGLQFNRNIFSLPAGPVPFALAAEIKRERVSFSNSPILRNAIGSGIETARDASAKRRVSSATAEIDLPIVNHVDLNVSARYDDYDDVGATFNPKVALRFQPVKQLLLRASYNTGFRAPTLYNIYGPLAIPLGNARNNDPVLCPGGVPNLSAGAVQSRDCNVTFPQSTGGNPRLKPEESHAFGLGAVIQITRSTSIGLDYFNYRLDKSIGTLSDTVILTNATKYAELIVRCNDVASSVLPLLPNCNNRTGNPVAYTIGTGLNLGKLNTSGVDATMQWSSGETRLGRFGFDYRGTRVLKYEYQLQPGGPFFSSNGQYFNGFPVIRYTHQAAVRWNGAAWSADVSNRFESAYTDCNAGCNISSAFFNRVGSYSLWNASLTYAPTRSLSVSALVTNVLNTEPNFSNKNSGQGSGYDERFTDPLGRAYTLRFSYNFEGTP